jgi:hypothetical protein
MSRGRRKGLRPTQRPAPSATIQEGGSVVCFRDLLPSDLLLAFDIDASERARILDRDWFTQHPGITERTRSAIPGEVPGATAMHTILVRQIAPGQRERTIVEVQS